MQAEPRFPRRRIFLSAMLVVLAALVLGIVELRARQTHERTLRRVCDQLGVEHEEGDTVPLVLERAFLPGTTLDRFFETVAEIPGLAITDLGAHDGCGQGVMIWLQVSYQQMGLPQDPLGLYGGYAERFLCFEDSRLVAAWKSDPSYSY